MTTIAVPTAESTSAGRAPIARVAGIAGLSAVVIGMVQGVIVGDLPTLGASTEEVVDFFSGDSDALRIGVVVPALLAIPLALFMIGVYRTLAAADRRNDSWWARSFCTDRS